MGPRKSNRRVAAFLCAFVGITLLTATATSQFLDDNDAGLGGPPPLEVGDAMIVAGRHVGAAVRTISPGHEKKANPLNTFTEVDGTATTPSREESVAVAINESRVEVVTPSARVTGPPGTSPRCTGAFCQPTKDPGDSCDCHAECNDGLRCNGEERCEDDGTGTFRCVAGAETQPTETGGCLENVDMPGGSIPGDSGNTDRCQPGISDCDTNGFSACVEPELCKQLICASRFCIDNYCGNGSPGSGECSSSDPGRRNFCFQHPGGDLGQRCVDEATTSLANPNGPGTCTAGTDCPSGTCLLDFGSPGFCACDDDSQCVNNDCNEARRTCRPTGYECDFMLNPGDPSAGDCALVIGTCCVPGADPAVDAPECIGTDIIDCNNDPLGNGRDGIWTSDRESNRNNSGPIGGPITAEVGCINDCARYSSGIRYPDQGNPVGGGAPGVIDLGPVVEVSCNDNGFDSIGDDYVLAGGEPIVLERFSFTGGVDSGVGTSLVFQFYDTSFNLAAELHIEAGRTKGIRTYGDRQNPIYRNGFMSQPIIPAAGYIVMKSPTIDAQGKRDVQGHWFTTNTAPIFGDNDPSSMWINGVVADHSAVIGAGNSQVLSFELRGVPLVDTPLRTPGGAEACCDSFGSCTDTMPWLCQTCQSGGASGEFCTADRDCWRCSHDSGIRCWSDAFCDNLWAGATCDMGGTCGSGSFMARQGQCQKDSDCPESSPGAGDATCVFYANAMALPTDEFPASGYCLNQCNAAPCTDGACCAADGTCTIVANEAICANSGGAWQGYGEDCDPNCCPAGSTGGDFCGDAVPYVLSVPSVPGEAFVHTITTTTADSIVGPGTGPIEGECEFTSCSETGYCDGDPAASCNVLAQDCAAGTGPCLDLRCATAADCPAGETCRRKPCADQKPLGHVLACAPGRCESDSSIRCRTAGDCPLGINDDTCLNLETCERFDCGDPNIPSLGWRVAGSDPVRWEAFTLTDCADVTIDYCCTDDNPNVADGHAQPSVRFFDICEPGETRQKYCEGLTQPDYPFGTMCTTDAECPVGACSVGGVPCHDSNECPLGTCTGAAGVPCRRDEECPSGETCNGGSLCVGGKACERLRDFCGPRDDEIVLPIFPDPSIPERYYPCDDGDLNFGWIYELPAGNYYIPIRALQTCTTGGPCHSDNDCPNGGVCRIYEHEYQIHITTRSCPQTTCCHLGEICEGADVNDPASECLNSTVGTCETSGNPCSTDDDCEPGVCTGGTGDPCTSDNDCTLPEMCQNDGTCGIRSGTSCTSDTDCTMEYLRGDGATLTETCQPDGLCGYTCHRTYAAPAVITPSDFCPTAPGAVCAGFEECILVDCPQKVCRDDFSTCVNDADCTQGTCSVSGDPCHRDTDCQPGNCITFNAYCRRDEECWDFAGCPTPELCVGGASCDPHQCVGDQPLCSFTDQRTCEDALGGFWLEGVDACTPPGFPMDENVCFIGACCTDDTSDACKDAAPYNSVEGCAAFGGASLFLPGATCAADPCPVCEIEEDANCQFFDVSTSSISRCDMASGTSIPSWRCADDFVSATTAPLDRVCWWPAFAPTGGGPECSQPGETPADAFRVRIYPDLGHVPDEGGELGPAGGQPLNVDFKAPVLGRMWQYSAPLETPIVLTANECYWLEITGEGTPVCDVFWGTSNRGNHHAMMDFNFPDFGRYTSEDASNTDFAWCVSTGIVSVSPTESGCGNVLGACCACGDPGQPPICQETSQDQCDTVTGGTGFSGKWKIYRRCDTDGNGTGDGDKCWENTDCDSSPGAGDGVCTEPEGGQCGINPCGGEPANDACANGFTISHVGAHCAGDQATSCDVLLNDCAGATGPCVPDDINDVNNNTFPNSVLTDIRCATTDGPATNCGANPGDLSFDVWFNYAAPVCGTLTVQNCNSLPIHDGFGAIYRKGDFTAGNECAEILAGDSVEATCNDDGCGAGGPWFYSLGVAEGEELIIRVGAWFDGDPSNYARAVDEGSFELHLEPGVAEPDGGCPRTASEPLPAPYPHDRRKNRYISFDPNKTANDGLNIAFKVELKAITMGSCDGPTGGPVDFCRPDHNECTGASGVPCDTDADCPVTETCRGRSCEGVRCASDLDCPPGETCLSPDCNACSLDGNTCINRLIDCAPSPPQTCEPTGEICVNDAPDIGGSNVGRVWWVGPESPLGNSVHLMVSQPFRKVSADWPNPTHVGDCEIVPEAYYGVRAVNVDTSAESDELPIGTTLFAPATSSWWGDCIGLLLKHCGPDAAANAPGDIREPRCDTDADCSAPNPFCRRSWEMPNGAVNFDDFNAMLALIAPGANSVAPDPTWVDLHGNATGTPGSQAFDPPNFVLNFSDIGQIISGFGGFPYKGYDPADCPDTSTWP